MKLPELKIGDLTARVPIIQGGMGIGISLHKLAGNVAAQGGIGILSTAQIGFQEENFRRAPVKTNLKAIQTQLDKARAIAKEGILGFNVMVACFRYDDVVKHCVEAGADVIISGAGLPMNLPELVGNAKTKIAPIVSSVKATKIILRNWAKKYNRTADFIVIEGPEGGGHLGFKANQIEEAILGMDDEIIQIIAHVKEYEEKFNISIPVIFAGGVWNRSDIAHYLSLGCSGVQMATRFIGTVECDAPDDFKDRFIQANENDIHLTTSPVGLPGRAIDNKFTEIIKNGLADYKAQDAPKTPLIPIASCLNCLQTKLCDRKTIPYCISEALLNSVEHNTDMGLLFSGTNGYRINEITTVKAIFDELTASF
ncbi:2-nitropropane dioxygenase [Lactococcus hodotermopsidis]|uniref:Probable nitronate monooxygenase n=1 Tax=Pseudolactococcus hodotermopsidis TaxID=2709157 RepID=A0A6A0B8K4_9LACT|nr:nitronate monooxygenase [Lactococcus hodotermopsidis]GFH41652.1 2-nitropropane dioxygenase [Lactococcus hodotermopsidis]